MHKSWKIEPLVARLHFFILNEDPGQMSSEALILDDREMARADAFRFARDRLRYISAHAQTRRILGQYLGLTANSLRIAELPSGKPILQDHPHLHFNLSHSQDIAMLGVAGAEIGVDVELMRVISDLDDIAEYNFSKREVAEIKAASPNDRYNAFFAIWCRKEAFVKATGHGLSTPLSSFAVNSKLPARVCEIDGNEAGTAQWSMWSQCLNKKAWAAAAIQERNVRFLFEYRDYYL